MQDDLVGATLHQPGSGEASRCGLHGYRQHLVTMVMDGSGDRWAASCDTIPGVHKALLPIPPPLVRVTNISKSNKV